MGGAAKRARQGLRRRGTRRSRARRLAEVYKGTRLWHEDGRFKEKSRSDAGGSYIAVRISQPWRVTMTVCSNCADKLPSLVTTVHPSSRKITSGAPRLI